MADQQSKSNGTTEDRFQSFGKRVDGFIDELNEAGERLRKEFADRYEELKESAERLRQEAKDKKRWDEVESSLKKAAEELRTAFHAAFRKHPKE